MIKRIQNQKNGSLNEVDRLALAQLLIKAGYTVRLTRERQSQKSNAPYNHFIEYWEDDNTTKEGQA